MAEVSSVEVIGQEAMFASSSRRGVIALVLLVTACGGGGSGGSSSATPGIVTNQPHGPADTTGVSDTEIKWGTTFPLSGNPAAAYAPIAYGMDAFFKYINAQGGVYGRKITLNIGDDHYNPADTVEVTRQLVEGDKVFGMIGNLGDATQLAVYKYLEEKGVPNMFLSTGLAIWTNPIVKSRFGGNPDYITEGKFLAQYIVKNFPGKKVGFLLQNDQLGDDGETGLKNGLAGQRREDRRRGEVRGNPVRRIRSDAAAEERRRGSGRRLRHPAASRQHGQARPARRSTGTFPSSSAASTAATSSSLLATPKDSEGVISFTFGHQAYETELPGVQKYEKIWAKYGNGGSLSNFELYGMFVAELNIYILEHDRPGPQPPVLPRRRRIDLPVHVHYLSRLRARQSRARRTTSPRRSSCTTRS